MEINDTKYRELTKIHQEELLFRKRLGHRIEIDPICFVTLVSRQLRTASLRREGTVEELQHGGQIVNSQESQPAGSGLVAQVIAAGQVR